MKNEDTRVQFTKRALKDALLRILKSKPIGKVSIKSNGAKSRWEKVKI